MKKDKSTFSGQNLEALIEQYNQELMRTYRQSRLPAEDNTIETSPAKPLAETDNVDILKDETVQETPSQNSETARVFSWEEIPPVPIIHAPDIAAEKEIPSKHEGFDIESPSDDFDAEVIPAPIILPSPAVAVNAEAEQEITQCIDDTSPHEEITGARGEAAPSDTPVDPDEEDNGETEESEDIGYLQVQVYSARGAIPISDAHITISRDDNGENTVMALTFSDSSGYSPVIALPTLSRDLSLRPGTPAPFIAYNVRVDVPGFFTVTNLHVPIYGGITSVQPAEMIALPENYKGDGQLVFPENGPAEL